MEDYDALVNELVSMYFQKQFPGWTMTDEDCAQLRRQKDNTSYEFVDVGIRRGATDTYVAVHHGIVDLNDYTREELWEIGRMYYENEVEFFSQGDAIIAECVFETLHDTYWGGSDVILRQYLEIAKGKEESQ